MQTREYRKLTKLLTSDDRKTVQQGVAKCLAHNDLKTIIDKITRSYIYGYVFYEMIPALQDDPELAQRVRSALPRHYKLRHDEWMARTLYFVDKLSETEYCSFISNRMCASVPDFPGITPLSLEFTGKYSCAAIKEADSRIDGSGWVLYFESRDVGPAEVTHEEEWRATAYHSNKTVKFCYLFSSGYFTKLWMEETVE